VKTFDLTFFLGKEENGYVSKCPELGIASCGHSIAEETATLKEACLSYQGKTFFCKEIYYSFNRCENHSYCLETRR
jgi:hypothetical protein